MTRGLYALLLRLLFPIIFLMLAVRGWRNPRAAIPWRERLAWRLPPAPTGDAAPVWVHAVSLGEVQAAAAFVAALHARDPRRPLLVTVGTLTGMERARVAFRALCSGPGAPVTLAFAPLDLPGAVRRFLEHFRPAALLLLEVEIWPNLLKGCEQRGIPVGIASARLSAQSAARYRRFGSRLMLDAMRRLRAIAAQTADDAERFVAVGVPRERVAVGGNLKFDFALPAELGARAATLRAALGSRRVWVAGSTHEGEEAICLEAQRALERRPGGPAPLLILVPRIPGRFAAVADGLQGQAVAFARRSRGAPPLPADSSVLLVDTLGELMDFYATAEVAFVGGTLVPVGGHNLLEPAALALPVICGPHTHNGPQIARLLAAAGALTVVADAAQLAARLGELFDDGAVRAAAGAAGRAVVEANRGAVERCLAALAPVLPPPA